MAITKVEDLGDTIPTIIEEAQFIRQFKAVMRGLAWTIRKGKGSTVNVPYMSEVTSNQLQEGIDMTGSETLVDTNVQITPNEKGLKVILTDSVIEDDNEDLKRAAGALMGDAYEKKLDQDLFARLDNGTTSLGGSGTTLTMGHVAAARALLAGNPTSAGGPAPTPYACVLHPFVELDIIDVVTPVLPAAGTTQSFGDGPLTADILRNYSVGRLFGMPVILDGNTNPDASSNIKQGVFSTGKNGGIIYVPAREPTVEPQRDASLRGWELNYVGRYGVGNWFNGYTVELYTDASSPS